MKFVLFFLLLASSPALAVDLPATPTNLPAVFAKARPGDVLRPAGAFGVVVLQGRAFDPPLVVDASAATFQAVIVKSVSGVRWRGGTVMTSSKGRDAFNVNGAQDFSIERLRTAGDGTAGGVVFRDSQDVALLASRLDRPRVGISTVNVNRARIVGNTIVGWSADGVGLASTTDSLISQNSLTDPIRIDPGIHIDGIQGYFTGVTANRNLTVSYNFIRGAGTQGVFFNDYPGYPAPQSITLEGNTVITSDAPNGVALAADPSGVVRNNHVVTLPGSKWITLVSVLHPATRRCGNTAEAHGPWKAVIDAPCAP